MSDEFESISLNLDGVKTDGFAPIPENTYDVRVAEVKTSQSKNGNPMINLTLEITTGEYEGRRLWENLVITEKAMWKVKKVLEALTSEEWSADNMELKPSELVGYSARALVVQEPHWDEAKANAGQVVNRIDDYVTEDAGSGGLSLT